MAGSRFCRYFAWSRSFVVCLLKSSFFAGQGGPRGGRQILSLFCVITLPIIKSCRYFAWSRDRRADFVAILRDHATGEPIWLTSGTSRWANLVAILRDHAHFADRQLSSRSRFCRYFAWSRSFWWYSACQYPGLVFKAQNGPQIGPGGPQFSPRGPKFGPHSGVFFDHDECMHWGPGEKLQTSSEK